MTPPTDINARCEERRPAAAGQWVCARPPHPAHPDDHYFTLEGQ